MDTLGGHAYVVLNSAMAEGSLFLVVRKYLKCRSDRKYGMWLLYLLFVLNDMFWGYNSLADEKIYSLYLPWTLFVYIAAYLILSFCSAENLFDSFLRVFTMEMVMQVVLTICTFPFYAIECGGDMERIALFMDEPSLPHVLIFTIQYAAGYFIFDKTWAYLSRLKGTFFKLLSVLLAFLDVSTNMFYGWRAVIVVILLFAVGLLYIWSRQNKEERYLEQQRDYYRALEEAHRQEAKEIAEIRHDIANHLSVMEELERDESGREILKAIDKSKGVYTGIPVLDCLFAEKEKICEKKGVAFAKEIEPIGTCAVSEYDLVSLFANLLDNAIEAAEQTPHPKITLSVQKQQGYLKILLSNTKLPQQTVKDGFQTTKRDRRNHGIGNRIIKKIVSNHDGRVTYEEEPDKMTVTAMLAI